MTPILTIPFSESKGRVVDLVIYSKACEAAIVRWQDGAYSFIGYESGYDPGDGNLRDEQWGDRDFLDDEIVAAGIMTRRELDQQRVDHRAANEKRQQAERLEAFRRLKREFEPEE